MVFFVLSSRQLYFLVCFASFDVMGVSMVLVGETLMRAEDPGKAIRALLGKEEPTPVRK